MRLRYVGAALRTLREIRGYAVRGLAKRAGITAAMVSRYECGRGYPSLRTLFDVLTALDADLPIFQRAIEAAAEAERQRLALLDPPPSKR